MKCKILASVVLAMSLGVVPAALAQKSSQPAPSVAEKPALPGLAVGEKAPDAELWNMKGEPVKLSSLYKEGPTVIVFYRGGWCPYCNRSLIEWQGKTDELKAAGGRLVALTPEKPEKGLKTIEKDHLEFTVLSDYKMDAAKAYKVIFELDQGLRSKYKGFGADLEQWNASGTWELPAACTFVVDAGGTIRYAFRDWDYKKRADPTEVIAAVRALKSPPSKPDK